jgi:hypothetical protein
MLYVIECRNSVLTERDSEPSMGDDMSSEAAEGWVAPGVRGGMCHEVWQSDFLWLYLSSTH